MGWGNPVRGGYITSPYGPRDKPTDNASSWHQGTDIGGRDTDWMVRSIGDGAVHATGWNNVRGWWVVIRHTDGTTSTYQHLVKPLVSGGSKIEQGDIVGQMGMSGESSGTHLHMETFLAGNFLYYETAWISTGRTTDPEVFLNARGVRLGDSSTDDKTPEYRPDDDDTTDGEHDMRIIQRGSSGSIYLISFEGYQAISAQEKDAYVSAGFPFKAVDPATCDAITSSLRKVANRTVNPALATSVWRDETASFRGGPQQTMAAHVVSTREAATDSAASAKTAADKATANRQRIGGNTGADTLTTRIIRIEDAVGVKASATDPVPEPTVDAPTA